MPPLQNMQEVRSSSAKLYRGENKEPIGQVLARLATTGRDVIRQQRTRWMENRSYFRGDQWLQVNPAANQVRALSRNDIRGRRLDTFNRLRQFTEGRIALLTGEPPSYEVQPPNQDQDSIEAARQATKFVKAMWGREGWNVQAILREIALDGEIDGIVFLCVEWDRYSGMRTRQPYLRPEAQGFLETLPPDTAQKAVGPGGLILDRSVLESLKDQDPDGKTLWEDRLERLGDVKFRVVRPGALAVDPFATKMDEARWIIESSVHSRSEIEAMAGRKIEAIMKDSEAALNGTGREFSTSQATDIPDAVVDDGDTMTRTLPGRDSVLCHRAFHLPCKDFPYGAHVYWLDKAPHAPIIMEPYDDDELPYMAYTPKPDGGHFLRSRGTVDDLKPMQAALNRRLTQLSKYLDRVANPPLAMPRGSMHSPSVYNESGYFEYHPGYQTPQFMQVPAEPTAIITNHLQWIEQQMAEVAVQSGASRGQAPGQGVEAAVGINLLIQQTEQQLSGTEGQLKAILEWGISRALRLVGRHYTAPRMLAMPGVDNTVEMAAFNSEMIGGAHRFRVSGRMTPRSKAEQWQAMTQFIPMLGPDARPYISQFISGDIDEFRQNEEGQRARQKREIRQMLALVNNETVKKIWDDFQTELQAYSQAVQAAQPIVSAMSQGMPMQPGAPPPSSPMSNPMEYLAMQGIVKPNFTDMLRQGGFTVPTVEEYDNHAQHIMVLDAACISDGHDFAPPIQRQLEREHREAHLNKIGIQAASMGAQMAEMPQQGSAPAEKGTPSPPKGDQGNGGGGTPPQLSRMPQPGGVSG